MACGLVHGTNVCTVFNDDDKPLGAKETKIKMVID